MAAIESSRHPAARRRLRTASTVAGSGKSIAANRSRLLQIIGALEHIHSAAIVSTQALQHQNAEQDRDIASVLGCCVNEQLEREIINLRHLYRTR